MNLERFRMFRGDGPVVIVDVKTRKSGEVTVVAKVEITRKTRGREAALADLADQLEQSAEDVREMRARLIKRETRRSVGR